MREGLNKVNLGSVCDIIGGGTPSKSKTEYYNGIIPWATVRDMRSELLEKTELTITEEAIKNSSTNIITRGNVIIATRVGLGKVCILSQDTAINQDLKGVIPKKNNVTPEYLFWWFKSISEEIVNAGTGLTVQGVKLPFIKALLFPIISISEQQQIVNILDQAYEAIDQAKANIERNIENAKELFQSKLNDIFSQKGEGWEEKKVSSISNVINGYSFKSKDFSADNEVKSIKITNVGIMEFVEDSSNNLPANYLQEYSRVKVHEGDLVLALTRTIISGGLKVARVPESYHNSLLNQRVAAIVPNADVIDSDYLYYYFSSNIVYNYVLENVNTLMQPNLSITDLKRMTIPITSIEGQRKISIQIESLSEEVNSLISNYQTKLDDIEELKKSILQKAFAGELTNKTVEV
jgi:type I restriction enzyme S subunit